MKFYKVYEESDEKCAFERKRGKEREREKNLKQEKRSRSQIRRDDEIYAITCACISHLPGAVMEEREEERKKYVYDGNATV